MGGRTGTRPMPTALRIAEGNRSRRPLNDREPKPRIAIPLPPPGLSKVGRKEWKRAGTILYDMRILSDADRSTLFSYCFEFELMCEAVHGLRRPKCRGGGLIVTNKDGRIVPNPLLQIAKVAARDMNRFAMELGLTPASRSRIKVDELPLPPGGEAEGDDNADEFGLAG